MTRRDSAQRAVAEGRADPWPRRPLTPQQAEILKWAHRGYPAGDIAKAVGCHRSLVSDQIGFIRKKGYDAPLAKAGPRLNRVEAARIARSLSHRQ